MEKGSDLNGEGGPTLPAIADTLSGHSSNRTLLSSLQRSVVPGRSSGV
jgi:hypothetical protein